MAAQLDMTDGPESYDFLFKLLIIGNSGVGKSCVLNHFMEEQFRVDSNHTIGVEFGSKIITVSDRKVKLQIWDTAGQERFRAVTRSYYRKAAGALLVYDITDRSTFNALETWLSDAKELSGEGIVIILVGNKNDKAEEHREVTFVEGSQFAQENNLMFIETSALTGENVQSAFVNVSRRIMHNMETGRIESETGGGLRSASLRRPHLRGDTEGSSCSC